MADETEKDLEEKLSEIAEAKKTASQVTKTTKSIVQKSAGRGHIEFVEFNSESSGKAGENSASLFVSLYLVILAFFILLNTIANIQQEKTEFAMNSLDQSFGFTKEDFAIPQIQLVQRAGDEITTAQYLDSVGTLVREAVTLVDAKIIETGDTMHITLPVDSFYYENEAVIRAEHENFLMELAKQVSKIQRNARIDMEYVIGSEPLTEYPTAVNNLPLARAGEFARIMAELGVGEDRMFIGMSPGSDPTMLSLVFQPRDVEGEEVAPALPPEPTKQDGT